MKMLRLFYDDGLIKSHKPIDNGRIRPIIITKRGLRLLYHLKIVVEAHQRNKFL